MDDNSECNDDEVVLTEDEEEVLLKANNAFTSTLIDIDLRSNPRLKNKMLRSFEKYKEETKALLMKLKLKNKYLQVKLQDQNDEIKELKIGLAKEKEHIGVDPKDCEEARWVNTDLKVKLEEAKRIEDVMKFQLEEKERENQRLEMEVVGLRKNIEKSKDHVKFNEISVSKDFLLQVWPWVQEGRRQIERSLVVSKNSRSWSINDQG